MNPINAQKLTDELTALLSRDVIRALATDMWEQSRDDAYILVTNAPESADPDSAISISLPYSWAWFTLPSVERGRMVRHEMPRRQVRIVALPSTEARRGAFDGIYQIDSSTALVPDAFLRLLPKMIAEGEIKRLTRVAIAA